MDDHWASVQRWFERVADLAEGEGAALLARECEDPAVRAEVLELLRAGARAGDELEPSGAFRRSLGGGLAPQDERGKRAGPYRLDSLLGRGGMGSVWLAHREDDVYHKQVAVKVVKRGLDTDEILRRFQRERQVLARLEHPGIARLIDGGATEDGRPYMVLEHVEGTPIDHWCDERGLSLRERLELFREVCDAVQYAHRNLVVHRDLKPSNVLVTAEGRPKLLDFGIAKLLDPDEQGLTVTAEDGGSFMTPEFASPEQVRGEPITTSSDVYSLGVVLYRLLTGRLPHRFTTRLRSEIERVVCSEVPERPSVTRRELSGDLDTIVLEALRKEPERRYASVEQLSEDVRRHLEGLPLLACPDSLGYRLGKLIARNRLVFGAAALVFVTMAVSLVVIANLLAESRRSGALAERRFGEVRELAREVIFELHDAIAPLPGATVARHRLVETGLRYLDGLASEAGDDPALLRELVDGYVRLGDVLGRPTGASLGDSAAALAAHERALALLEELRELRPGQVGLELESALAVDRIGTLVLRLARTEEALAHFDRALETVAEVGDAGSLATVLYHRAEALTVLGDTEQAVASAEESLSAARAWHAERRTDRQARRTLQTVLFKLADLHLATGEPTRAEAEASESSALAEALATEAAGDATAERDLALAVAMLARVHIEGGRANEARELVARQLRLFESLRAADPANLQARRDLSIAHERAASLAAAEGRLEQALEGFRRSVELDEHVVGADPGNTEWRRNLALSLEKVCGTALSLGLADDARSAAERMLEELDPLLRADPHDVQSRRLSAMARFRLAQLDLERAAHAAAIEGFEGAYGDFARLSAQDPRDAWTKRMAMVARYFVGWTHRERGHEESLPTHDRLRHLRAACAELELSLELAAELRELGFLLPGDDEQGRAVEAEIEACRAAIEVLSR